MTARAGRLRWARMAERAMQRRSHAPRRSWQPGRSPRPPLRARARLWVPVGARSMPPAAQAPAVSTQRWSIAVPTDQRGGGWWGWGGAPASSSAARQIAKSARTCSRRPPRAANRQARRLAAGWLPPASRDFAAGHAPCAPTSGAPVRARSGVLAAVLASLVLAVISEFFFPGHITLGAGFMKSLYVPWYWSIVRVLLLAESTRGVDQCAHQRHEPQTPGAALRWPPHSGNAARRGER